MDRRQRKTREAIFYAFSELLSKKSYNQISVQEIIDTANVGRTTFYSHFETKDFLLKEMCEELFKHITETAYGLTDRKPSCLFGSDMETVFLHLLLHLQENDLHILELLSSQNNEIFLRYFKSDLKELIVSLYAEKGVLDNELLPKDYLVNHISSSFVETVSWWLAQGMRETPEKVTDYFIASIAPLLSK